MNDLLFAENVNTYKFQVFFLTRVPHQNLENASSESSDSRGIPNYGTIRWPILDEFSEKFRRGRGVGVISNPKNHVADFCGNFVTNFWKKTVNLWKGGGGDPKICCRFLGFPEKAQHM